MIGNAQRLVLLAAVLAAACSSSTPPPPAPDAGPVPTCLEATPCVLTSGTPVSGTIGVVAQNDLYTIALAAGVTQRTLLKVQLANVAPASPVRLVAFVETPDGQTVLGNRGPVAGTGAQSLSFNLLLPGPGVYRVRVRDAFSTHVDAKNPYTLTATLLPDPDAGEPDDAPAKARAITPAVGAGATATGYIASTGDRDLLGFSLALPQLLRVQVAQAAVPAGPLRLRARLLLRSATAPDDLTLATPVIDTQAATAGAALAVDLIRSVPAGSYLVALEDAAGTGADERAAAQWSVTLGLVTEPDPNEQNGRNDTPDKATSLVPGQSKEGAIGSLGDVDWYQLDLPASATPQLLQLTLDPQQANSTVQLNWAVGTLLDTPAGPCDFTCTLTAFCSGGLADGGGAQCAYKAHAFHQFAHAETAPQVIRIRHAGPAETVRVLVNDRSGASRSADLYKLTAALLPDPDPNERNDSSSTATVVQPVAGAGSNFSAGASGMISWWDFLDGKTTAEQAADLDWYELQLPPPVPAPDCPLPPDAGPADAGDDAGSATSTDAGVDAGDAGPPNRLPDGGVCGPDPYDGGPVYLPRPDYGLVMKWKNPDSTYRIAFQGHSPVDGGTACFFGFDDSQGAGTANAKDAGGGFLQVGDAPYTTTDPCLCLAGAQAESGRLQVRVEAAHRPAPPGVNAYTDQPYQFSLEFRPGALAPSCDGGCAPHLKPSACF
jgi:hypothetical protein